MGQGQGACKVALPVVQMATFLLCTDMAFPLCMGLPDVSSSYMDTRPIGLWPYLTLIASLNSICLQIQSHLWLGVQYMNWGPGRGWGRGGVTMLSITIMKVCC